MKRTDIDDLDVYNISMEIGEEVWKLVKSWHDSSRKMIGNQLLRSADSIATNISEGYGRYFYKENRQFCYFARGSLYETITWIKKAAKRNFIDLKTSKELLDTLEILLKKLNAYINYIEKQIDTNRE